MVELPTIITGDELLKMEFKSNPNVYYDEEHDCFTVYHLDIDSCRIENTRELLVWVEYLIGISSDTISINDIHDFIHTVIETKKWNETIPWGC